MSGDTEIGGPQKQFPRTTAEFGARLRDPGTAAQQSVMATLAQRYWKPVYHYLRMTFSKGSEDAKDLTQAFFLWILEREVLLKFDPKRSSFRTFLKGLLRNFAGNEHQALQRLKRGGGARHVPVDALAVEADRSGAPAERDPEKLFDWVWMQDVVARAVDRVRERFKAGRKIVPILAFEQYDLVPGAPPTYAELAARLGVKESDVRNYLADVRRQVREEARAELAELAWGPDAPAEDWSAFFKS